jgi:hypothetical protein
MRCTAQIQLHKISMATSSPALTMITEPVSVGEASQTTTVYFFQPKWMRADSSAVLARVGIHVHAASFSRAQLTAISDRACKVIPEAYQKEADQTVAEPVVLHYSAHDKVLNVDVPASSQGVRAALDLPGAHGSAALFSVVRELRKTSAPADAMVLIFKSSEAPAVMTNDPTDVAGVIRDAVKAVDVAVYTEVDYSGDANLAAFFAMLK